MTTTLFPASAWNHDPAVAMMLASTVLVVGAILGEVIARVTRLPRIVGYTLAGWIAVALGHGVAVPLEGVAGLVIDLALAVLLFEIGSRVRLRWLRRNPGLLATSLLEASLSAVAVYATLIALDIPKQAAIACAVLSMPASAAVAGRVALEMGADGQVTQRMAVLTAMNTALAVVALIALKATIVAGKSIHWTDAVVAVVATSGFSLALAIALAAAVGLVVRRMDLVSDSTVLPILGLILLAVGVARWVGASALLVPLLAGVLLRNFTEHAWVWPRHFGSAGGVLVLMLFVIVGASWSPQALAAGGLAAVALLVSRGLAKSAAVLALARHSHLSLRQGIALAITLTPLSATALVMLSDLLRSLPELGTTVAPIVLTAVAVLELLGPVAVLLALRHAGELAPAHAARKNSR